MLKRSLIGGCLLYVAATPAFGQRRLAEVPSLGQPRQWELYGVPAAHRSATKDWHSQLTLGVHRPLMNPVTGLLGVAGEAFVTGDPGVEGGARLLATSRMLGLSAGVDWDARSRSVDGLVSFQTAVRRGGLLGRGTMLRVDWYPGRADALNIGVQVPFASPTLGKGRPLDTDVDPVDTYQAPMSDKDLPVEAGKVLARVAESAATLLEYTNLYPERSGAVSFGPSFAAVSQSYQSALAEAFRIAVGNALLGDAVVQRARVGVVHDVLIPFDAQLGQVKEDERSIRPFTSAAQGHFVAWLRDSSRMDAAAQRRASAVHARWMAVIENAHRILLRQAKDSRLVWMPLQLALTEREYDEQSEVDSLIERAVGRRFSDDNGLAYLETADIPMEIARSIFATRDYHVLWTHDFTGQREDKSLDEMGYAMVADVYLPALVAAVQRYDSTRVMPIYMILIDQFYYASRNGRLWMDILENPLHAKIRLPGNNAQREAHLRERQQQLRDAVAKSWRLQQDATANGGDRWLPDVIRVNVSVLQPADWSFRSHRIVPPLPFVPDHLMRDHRKAVFYDLSEDDPFRGSALVMGVGVGEHYSSTTWEDRAYRVRGPVALELRDAARIALISSGMRPSAVPGVLSARGKWQRGGQREPEYVGRALQLHNEAGWGAKRSSVARAMLYNLAPAGSVIIVPDPIWVSDTWASMLAAAAARGCKVYVIAPSTENNPNPHGIIESAENEVLTRLLRSRDRMKEQLRLTGGELRIGLFTAKASYADAEGRRREVREGVRRYPWIRSVFPFDDRTLAVLDRAAVQSESDGTVTSTLAQDEKPRAPTLHQKTQLVARPGALSALVRQPGWEDILAAAMQAQSRQTANFADQLGFTRPDVDTNAVRRADVMLRGYESALSEAERKSVSFYFSMGTQNQDPRGLMMDGEATMLVSGFHAAAGVVDLYNLMARSTWVESSGEIDKLLPKPGWLTQALSRWFRAAL